VNTRVTQSAITGQRLAVLSLTRSSACGAAEILDVVRTHQFAGNKATREFGTLSKPPGTNKLRLKSSA